MGDHPFWVALFEWPLFGSGGLFSSKLASWLSALPVLSKWCGTSSYSFRYIILRPLPTFEGVHHRRSNWSSHPLCLQFPDRFKSRTAVLVRIDLYSSGLSKLTRNRGWMCLAAYRFRLRADRMQVQLALQPIISDRTLHPPWGCDYLNHWSSSFHAIQILVSVKRLS